MFLTLTVYIFGACLAHGIGQSVIGEQCAAAHGCDDVDDIASFLVTDNTPIGKNSKRPSADALKILKDTQAQIASARQKINADLFKKFDAAAKKMKTIMNSTLKMDAKAMKAAIKKRNATKAGFVNEREKVAVGMAVARANDEKRNAIRQKRFSLQAKLDSLVTLKANQQSKQMQYIANTEAQIKQIKKQDDTVKGQIKAERQVLKRAIRDTDFKAIADIIRAKEKIKQQKAAHGMVVDSLMASRKKWKATLNAEEEREAAAIVRSRLSTKKLQTKAKKITQALKALQSLKKRVKQQRVDNLKALNEARKAASGSR